MILPALVVVLILVGVPKVSAEAPAWAVDYTRSRLSFTASQMGQPLAGEFKRFDADVHFDPAALAKSRVTVRIETASVDTGSRDRDAAAREREWFDVARFPEARLTTQEIRANGDGQYVAAATLALRDMSLPVTLPFSLTIDGDEAHATGELTMARTDYGVGQGQWAAGDVIDRDVTVHFDLIARRQR